MRKKKKSHHAFSALALGSVAAILAAGATAYFFTQTKSGKAAAKKIKGTASDLSKEISVRLVRAKNISRKKYDEIVEHVVDEYAAQRKVGSHTVKALKRDLKDHWSAVKKELAHR